MASPQRIEELKGQAEALAQVVAEVFDGKAGIKFNPKPTAERRDLIEWQGKMRIAGMEIFNTSTYISYVNYFLSEADKQKKNALGAVVLYILETQLFTFITKMNYPKVDDENPEELKEGCGRICADITNNFQKKLASMGYPSLVMGNVDNARNTVPVGVAFNIKEYDKFLVTFCLDNKKMMAVEMTFGAMPKR